MKLSFCWKNCRFLIYVLAKCYKRLKTLNLHIFHPPRYFYHHFSTISIQIDWKTISCRFSSCSTLRSIIVESGNPIYDSRNNCNAIIETSSNTLIEGCRNTVIPNSVTAIGDNAFYECYYLVNLLIPNSVTSIGKNAFYECGIKSMTIPNTVTSIGSGAFSWCTSLKSISIPNSITAISGSTFYYCTGLTEIEIPNTVTSIGFQAFYYCVNLTNVIIPNSVRSIGKSAFYGCSRMSNVTIGKSVKTIDENAFSHCSSLTSITLPDSISSIGYRAFYYCSSLIKVICLAIVPPAVDFFSFYQNTQQNATLLVPNTSLEAYINHIYWRQFVNICGIGDINDDSNVSISDVSTLIDMLLNGGEIPVGADVNADGTVNISDVTTLIDILLNAN